MKYAHITGRLARLGALERHRLDGPPLLEAMEEYRRRTGELPRDPMLARDVRGILADIEEAHRRGGGRPARHRAPGDA